MSPRFDLVAVLAVLVARAAVVNAVDDAAQYVDQFIGTTNGGHVFAGANTPFGAVKAVADTSGGDNTGGFSGFDSPIFGISQTHDDGTGGSASLGHFELLPQYCSFDDTLTNGPAACGLVQATRVIGQKKGTAIASPGFFSLGLTNDVDTKVTSTDHVALHAFTYTDQQLANATSSQSQSGAQRIKYAKLGVESIDPSKAFSQDRDSDDVLGGLMKDLDQRLGLPTRRDVQQEEGSQSEKRALRTGKLATAGLQRRQTANSTSANSPVLLLDLTNDLPHTYQGLGSLSIAIGQDKTATFKGTGTFQPSFGTGTYQVHMCASVPYVKRAGIYSNSTLDASKLSVNNPAQYTETGALVELDAASIKANNNTLPVRIAISWSSQDKACQFLSAEIPDGSWTSSGTFDAVHEASRSRWNDVLGSTFKPVLDGVSDDQKKSFYSALYRAHLAPYNITGDNGAFETTEPTYDSYYCIWDSFRTTSPLLALLNPQVLSEQVRSLIDVYRHQGWMPDCRMSISKGFTQGGSNADTLLADAYVKGLNQGFGINWVDGLNAMIKDAEESPPDWGVEGRGGIEARKELGYVPQDGKGNDPPGPNVINGRSGSRTVEYSYNDFSIALVAAGEGKNDVYTDFIKRSGDVFNLWNPNRTVDGFAGVLDSRYTNGSFSYLEDPRKCSPAYQFGQCYLTLQDSDAQFYEASAIEYSFLVPHDMHRMIGLMGGDDQFIKRLDNAWDKQYNDIGDEQGFLPNYLYNYALNGYSKTVDRALYTLRKYFTTATNGVPNNDDSGAMGGFVVYTSLGLFPVAGQSVYLLATPLFPSYQVVSQVTGKTATVKANNWDGAQTNKYIQSATFNGQPYTKNWITHKDLFLNGGNLELTLGSAPSDFGAKAEDLPPTLSTGGFTLSNAGQGI